MEQLWEKGVSAQPASTVLLTDELVLTPHRIPLPFLPGPAACLLHTLDSKKDDLSLTSAAHPRQKEREITHTTRKFR